MHVPGRTALVTGAGARMGRVIATRLAEAGYALAIHHHRSVDGAGDLAREIERNGGSAAVFPADLSRAEAAEGLAREVLRAFGRIDLLVNNASLWIPTPIPTLTADQFDRLLAVNLRSPFLLSLYLGRSMKEKGTGQIINILDWSIDRPYPDYLPYGIAKAGLEAATRGLARALAPTVRVNAIAPGPVLLQEGLGPDEKEAILRAIPIGRIGEAEDVAGAVLYLLEADYATGTILTVDGGRSLH